MPMFEEELKLERQSSYLLPLLLLVGLVAMILGAVWYWIIPHQKDLSAAEAGDVITAFLKAQGPATVHFHTGLVKASVDEKPRDPHYRLLEKVGVLKLREGKNFVMQASLTPEGERILAQISGVEKTKNPDGTDAYTVPLAERQLVQIVKLTVNGRNRATVDYSWKWVPNQLGDAFDASGTVIKSFKVWDRTTLIQKYGADFYHGVPTSASLMLVRLDKAWKIATE